LPWGDFQTSAFCAANADLTPIVARPALGKRCSAASLGEKQYGFVQFKAITIRFSELMFDLRPSGYRRAFALIIPGRGPPGGPGLLRLRSSFRIHSGAYPYVARPAAGRGPPRRAREKLAGACSSTNKGRLQLQRRSKASWPWRRTGWAKADLLPVVGAGLRLLLGPRGRQPAPHGLLLMLVATTRLHTDDLQSAASILFAVATFSPLKLAGGMLKTVKPLARAWSSRGTTAGDRLGSLIDPWPAYSP